MKASPASPSPSEVIRLLKITDFKPNLPVVRQIATHLRGLVLQKKLPPYTRLPPLMELAKLWGTNYFTVHTAISRLTGEGLIVKNPRKGSFVAPPRRQLERVCLYHYGDPRMGWKQDFYTHLNVTLYRLLSQRGIVTVPFFDQRPFAELALAPRELRDMIRAGEVDAVIATTIYPRLAPALLLLEVPVASALFEVVDRTVTLDFAKMAREAVEAAHRMKRKTIGFIRPPSVELDSDFGPNVLQRHLEYFANKKGIAVVYPSPKTAKRFRHWEHLGARFADELLELKPRVDCLFVFPDPMLRGVVASLVKRGVRVPKDVLVISHRNAEMEIYVPFPMVWLTAKIEDFALALLEQIDEQVAGVQPQARLVPIHVHRETP